MRFLIPLACALLGLAACGGGDSPFDRTPSPTTLGATQTPLAGTPTATPADCEPTDYEVQDGDTLAALAETYGVTIEAIAEASNLDDPDVLAIGDPLTIPCPAEDAGTSPTDAPTATAEATAAEGT
ncbi:MAG TPA: LysM domain-containing protein [Dehalococcoidia bacterium]